MTSSNEPPRTDPPQSWDLDSELGGSSALEALITDFYDRLFADLMIGFFFLPHDKTRLIAHQLSYVRANLGAHRTRYEGTPMRRAHAHLPILGAHFDRRPTILSEVLRAHHVPEHVVTAWLDLDARLRPLIVRTGGKARDAILATDRAPDEP